MLMLYVPGGTFMMGSSEAEIEAQLAACEGITTYCTRKFYQDETPQHPVTIDGFWLDRTEVTNEQFAAFLNKHGNEAENGGQCAELNEGYIRIKEEDGEYVPMNRAEDHPVVMISWVGADAYCRWAGGRLPTEAEWEYAARGERGTIYPWGDERPNCDLANSGACAGTTLPATGQPAGASWCGAMGMAGNAWEWTADLFGPYSAAHQVNPTGSTTGGLRVLKGGGWHANDWMARSAFRLHDTGSSSHVGCIGFRCAYTLPEKAEK
jgi:formylglycine-generating enzyme required for sulfatase activity